jgi:hypothetical protein
MLNSVSCDLYSVLLGTEFIEFNIACFKVYNLQSQELEGMEATVVSVLPAELLGKILEWLPAEDLVEAVLVSRRWREMGEAPGLWAALVPCLSIRPANFHSAVEMLGVRRFEHLRELKVTSQDLVHLLTHRVCRWMMSPSPRSCLRLLASSRSW